LVYKNHITFLVLLIVLFTAASPVSAQELHYKEDNEVHKQKYSDLDTKNNIF